MNRPHRTLLLRAALAATVLTLAAVAVACGSDAGTRSGASDAGGTPATADGTSTSGPSDPAAPNELDVELVDYGFEAPSSVPAGITTVTVHDTGEQVHELQLARLNDGVTWDQIEATLHGDNPDLVGSMVTMVGGTGAVEADGTAAVTVDLAEGDHAILCFVTGYDGVSHLAHGMAKPLEVTSSDASAPAPEAKGDIVLDEMSITLPDDFDGTGVWRVVNQGEQVHQAMVMALADGVTREQFDAYLTSTTPTAGAPPATAIGGGGALAPGGQEWIDLDLAPGGYELICVVPDAAKGFIPHFMEGMVTDYTQP